MKRWKVYMVVGFSILAIGCASGCADKKNEIEPIKMVAEVQKAEDERKVVEKRIQPIAKEEDHVESENNKFRFQSKVKNHLLKIYIYTNGRSRRRLFTMRQS